MYRPPSRLIQPGPATHTSMSEDDTIVPSEAAEPRGLHIWVDADACPAVIKDILFRLADRRGIRLTLVANQPLRTPSSPYIRVLQVPRGFDVADAEIVARVQAGDLVVTADIPLAAAVIDKADPAADGR